MVVEAVAEEQQAEVEVSAVDRSGINTFTG